MTRFLFFLKSQAVTWFLGFSFFIVEVFTGVFLFPEFASAQEFHPSYSPHEFSARLIWKSGGKTSRAQLFVKEDRFRVEHQGGVRTELGYAGVTIVRLDEEKVWYILSQRRLVVRVPLTADYLLPFSVKLAGEMRRTLIGDAFAGGRQARLYEVLVVNRSGFEEAYYEWVDAEREVLLKLVSQDRDWSVEYEHLVMSPQPDYYFEAPLGYRKIDAQEYRPEKG